MLNKHPANPPKGSFCFGCNQPFGAGAPAVKFESDLLPGPDQAELANLYFHPGHLIRYARRRNWNDLAEFIEKAGAASY